MKVYVARPSGFCFGAKRSVDIANNVGKAYSLGNILHNELLIEKLKEKGLTPLPFDELIKQPLGKVVIRAHGVPFGQLQKLKEKGFEVLDATCENVKKVYDIVIGCETQGYAIFIYGDKTHPETIGVAERVKNPVIIGTVEDIPENVPDKICLVSQTTKIKKQYEEIRDILHEKCSALKAFDTICLATSERQKEAANLAGKVDVMIVIGGKKSSNTRKLYEVCKNQNVNTFLIQSKSDLNDSWFTNAEKTGITAGASTPDFVINEVIEEIKKCSKET